MQAEPTVVGHVLADLSAHDVSCAPHVAARLVIELQGDPEATREVAAQLDQAQRQGLRPLPHPLPMTDSIESRYDSVEIDDRDRELLLAAVLCLDDRLDPLLAFDGRSAEELASGDVGGWLKIHAGHVSLADPRLAIWVQATTPVATVFEVHQRLHRIFAEQGERVDADWHRARASISGDPAAASDLTRIARELSEAGHTDRALRLAEEAAAHAVGVDRDEAALVAGVSAIAAGYAAESAAWLGSLFPDGAERFRLQGLGGFVVAQAHLQGAVPELDPTTFRPGADDAEDWYSWARAAAYAAVLCAERGDRRAMRTWLDALREGAMKVGAERELRDPVVALAWLISGESEVEDDAGPLSGEILGALRAALDGDIDRGLRVLAASESGVGVDRDPFVAGFEFSPLANAYRAVVEVLLLTWRGDIGAARERMLQASLDLPVALPFAGLGVVLMRRLDLAVLGELSPFTAALTAALPTGSKIDQLVDRGIQAYLAGAYDEAATFVRLWIDHGAPEPTLAVPGLDEVGQMPDGTASARIQPPDVALAQQLSQRIMATTDARWRSEGPEIAEAARGLSSPFSRGRVEAMLGIRSIIRDEHAAGRAHLLAAESLLDVAGASAWSRSVSARLAVLDAEEGAADQAPDPLWRCRSAWEPLLTTRELEAAMLVATGAKNRDISEALNVSVRTVEVFLGRVFAKLDVKTRGELTVLAYRTGQYL